MSVSRPPNNEGEHSFTPPKMALPMTFILRERFILVVSHELAEPPTLRIVDVSLFSPSTPLS